MRWSVTCICGMTRLIPRDLHFGEKFTLVPCPKCGARLSFRFWRWFLWRLH